MWSFVFLASVQLLIAEPSIDISTVHKGKHHTKSKSEEPHHHSFRHEKKFHRSEELSETGKEGEKKIHERNEEDDKVTDSTAYKVKKKEVDIKDTFTEKKSEEPKSERVKQRRNDNIEREGKKRNKVERNEDKSEEIPKSEKVKARNERKREMKDDYLTNQEKSKKENHKEDYEINGSRLSNPKSEKVRGQKEIKEEENIDEAMHKKGSELKSKKINLQKNQDKDNESTINEEEYPESDKEKPGITTEELDNDDSEEAATEKPEQPMESSVPSHIPSWQSTNAAKKEFVSDKVLTEEDLNSGSSESQEKSLKADAVKAEEENGHKRVGRLMLL